ncbi:hypothetical protein EVAR_53596_1 [Eumeta japonica]|uniref:Uncharacterized protein n=1 Tax=Eumeta variegata TaxID=151549 RepID=A0A4C1X2M0_EUMVA|nr:hypothetical protein EVAR_53596_1 [Eumeta japonica]
MITEEKSQLRRRRRPLEHRRRIRTALVSRSFARSARAAERGCELAAAGERKMIVTVRRAPLMDSAAAKMYPLTAPAAGRGRVRYLTKPLSSRHRCAAAVKRYAPSVEAVEATGLHAFRTLHGVVSNRGGRTRGS